MPGASSSTQWILAAACAGLLGCGGAPAAGTPDVPSLEELADIVRQGDRAGMEATLSTPGGELSGAQHYWFGRMAESLGQVDRALLEYRAAYEAAAAVVDLPVRLASQELIAGDSNRAAAALAAAAEQGNDSSELHYQAGLMFEARDEPALARVAFQRSIQRNPALPAAHFRLSEVLRELSEDVAAERALSEFQYWSAIRDAAQAAEQRAAGAAATSEMRAAAGTAWFHAAEFERAQVWFERALAQDPGNLDARAGLGIVLHAQELVEDARRELRRVLADAPEHPKALSELAWVEAQIDGYAAGRNRMEHAVKAAGDSAEAHHELGLLELEYGTPEAALEAFQAAIAREPTRVESHLGVAQTQYLLGDRAAARSHWERVLALDPDNPGALQSLAVLDAEGQR